MKWLLVVVAIVFSALSSAGPMPKNVRDLINKMQPLDDACRGGSGDNPRTISICKKRDAVINQIAASGWCYGPDDAPEYKKDWVLCKPQEQRAETISVYLQNEGKTGGTYPAGMSPLIVYPERKCPFDELAGSRNMVLATLSGVQQCSLLSGDTVFIVSPYTGVKVYETAFFVVARMNNDDTFTVLQPNFDGQLVMQNYLQNERKKMQRSLLGAPLPPRGSSN